MNLMKTVHAFPFLLVLQTQKKKPSAYPSLVTPNIADAEFIKAVNDLCFLSFVS